MRLVLYIYQAVLRLPRFHVVQIFLQAPVVPGHDGCRLQPHIADVPGFGDEAGDLLLLCGVADDEAVLVAVLVQPLLLLRPGEADAGHGDVEGEAGLVLAGSGGGDRVVSGGEGLLLGPVGVVAKIGLDGLVRQLLLLGVGAVGGGDLPVGHAVSRGPFHHGAQGFYGGLVRLGAFVFDLQQVVGDVAFDVHQMHRHIVLAQRLLAVDQDQEIRGGGGAGGQRLPFVEQGEGLLPRDAVRREAVDRLELDDRGAGVAAEAAVRRVGEVAQAGKGLLQPAHIVSLSAFFEGLVGFGRRFRDGHRAEGGGGGLLRHRRGGDQAAVAIAVLRAERREDRRRRRDGGDGAGRGFRRRQDVSFGAGEGHGLRGGLLEEACEG